MKQLQQYSARMLAAVLVVLAPSAFATGPDYTVISGAVDWTGVGTQILAVLALVAGVIVIFKGGKFVLRALRGA